MKKLLLICAVFVACSVRAQNLFWSFNDEQQPMTIAPECDAKFEEIRGGVFVPTVDEVYQYGLDFLNDPSDEIKRQAPYCFLSAALQGHADAQFQLAKLYNYGDILPQDDLSAYKWAFISALNGNKDAELFTLNLEQVLTTEDLQATSGAIQQARAEIQDNLHKKIAELEEEELELRQKADEEKAAKGRTLRAPRPTSLSHIFTEEDRY